MPDTWGDVSLSFFCSIPGPKHVDAAKELDIMKIMIKGVAQSREIKLPTKNSIL